MTLGFEQAGFQVAAAFDVDDRTVKYHKLNFPHGRTFKSDVAKLTGREILRLAELSQGSVDVLFGGPPCQGFSEIGRKEDGDARNLLILEFARLVRELQPRYFVVENVRGLLYSYSARILTSFVRRIRLAGYDVVRPIQLLNAFEYGVPQKRIRAFILGYRHGELPPSYPLPTTGDGRAASPTVADAIADLPDVTAHDELLISDVYFGKLGNPSEYARMLRCRPTNGYPKSNVGVTGCLRTMHSPSTVERFSVTAPGVYETRSRCYRLRLDGAAYTLRAGSDAQNGSFTAARPIHPTQARCITTREAARLHSFPDWFQFHPTKWHGFRQIGNAVPPLLAQAVGRAVKSAITGNTHTNRNGISHGHLKEGRRSRR